MLSIRLFSPIPFREDIGKRRPTAEECRKDLKVGLRGDVEEGHGVAILPFSAGWGPRVSAFRKGCGGCSQCVSAPDSPWN